jgi:dynein heavy chain 1
VELEKTVYKLTLHGSFRLFLTMDVNPRVPTTLLRASYVLVFEPPSGIKAAMTRSYTQAITQERSDQRPVQRAKLHFIVAWFNAVVQERLRYIPIGWSKTYEFNQSDQRCVLDCIDEWVDSMGQGREAIDPDSIPWDALRTLVSQSIFGGKIDNDFDQKILQSLVEYFFRKETFDVDYPLFTADEDSSAEPLVIPDFKSYKDFLGWTKQLPGIESPAWSGLPMNVEKLNRIRHAESLIASTRLLQGTDDDGLGGKAQAGDSAAGQTHWLVSLQKKVAAYNDVLPVELPTLQRAGALVRNPLFRFLERECLVLAGLLRTVRSDLQLVLEVCKGERKSTNHIKALAQSLHADAVPPHWKKYVVPDSMPAAEWLTDLARRVDQLRRLSGSDDQGRSGIWFGGLLGPEAFLIATQQATAQQHSWSLEELELKLDFDPSPEEIRRAVEERSGFIVHGLTIESAEFDPAERRIRLSSKLASSLPTINLRWVHRADASNARGQPTEEGSGGEQPAADFVSLPLYLTRSRKNLVCAVQVPTHGVPQHTWYQRGVALFAC